MTRKNSPITINPDGLMAPESWNLECQVLADIISYPDIMPTARGILHRSMFSTDAFMRAWDILNDMTDKGVTVDLSTIYARIDRETFMKVSARRPSLPGEAIDHCRALVEVSTRRLVFSRAYDMMTRAGNAGTDFAELLAMPGKLASDLITATRSGAGTQTVIDALNDFATAIQDNQTDQANGKRTRVPTGFPMLDKDTYNGFANGNLVVLAARPSVGKTAIMLQMALAASRAGFPTTVYSLEMTNRELMQRLVLSTGRVTAGQLADNAVDWSEMENAIREFDGLPLRFNDKCQTLDEICNDILLNHQRGQCSVAFIDHLHRIRSTDSRQTSYQAVTERTGRFKSLAMECGIPVVLLAQLNRMSENEKRSPDLVDLRDSGSIEQDADIVLMLERATNTRSDPNVNMWVRKNRQGPAGEVCICLRGSNSFTVFDEIHNTPPTWLPAEQNRWYNDL